ncbi:hypothetical protein Misp01_57280 [Microtetraspora sp. NBRC 13810]|uniref:serine hydrolase domain-containing protein n=1 Tax=Microtetraspora sp. NBRC 13810 TaxID=3030990 RepID=UPI0024A02E61|nr:serine hydrolase domain-containing protein [Microtetraspora sp. NBRC 13810]GLW10600.1 hypothetical protein Misp01_57280 [Microtetraspora sp. NBRC 13810]
MGALRGDPRGFGRRELFKLAAGAAVLPALGARPASASAARFTATGTTVAALAGLDAVMRDFMRERGISQAQLAVGREGRLLYARGYTLGGHEPVTRPDSLFRVASLSKHITATAITLLAQEGRLDLSAPVPGLLRLAPGPGRRADPRLAEVTVRRLLHHLGGWDRDLSGDPLWSDAAIAAALGVSLPLDHGLIMTYVTGRPLDHAPGTRVAYSNYGYMLLGRIVEKAGGTSYPAYVTERILRPLGITRMRPGRSPRARAAPGEVAYRSGLTRPDVTRPGGRPVPYPYGGFNLGTNDANCGWLASAPDLVRLATVFDPPSPVLTEDSIAAMFAAPETGVNPDGWYYGYGWQVRPLPGGRNTWHTGSMPGTYTLLTRRWDGIAYAALFNRRAEGTDPAYHVIDPLLYDAVSAVRRWPARDLTPALFRVPEPHRVLNAGS